MNKFNVYIFFIILSLRSYKTCDGFIGLTSPTSMVVQGFLLHLNEGSKDDWVANISDEEALLACYAYLQRKNRLGWPEAKERKEKRQQLEGFGWGEAGEYSIYDEDNDGEDDIDDEVIASSPQITYETDGDEEKEETFGGFTSMPTGPSEESSIRSKLKKQQWKDPAFRERWYRSRWGHHTKQTPDEKREELIHSRLASVPPSVWASPEFESLTDEEIQTAITTYANTYRKRSGKRKKPLPPKPEDLLLENEDQKLDRDMLFTPSEELMRERQQKRSLKAKKAYEKRKAGKKGEKQASTEASRLMSERGRRPTGSTPQDAMARISADLDACNQPRREDVEKVLEPGRLSRRKAVLKRILGEHFDLRGKCVPKDNGELEFVTQAPVPILGEFILKLLSDEEIEDSN